MSKNATWDMIGKSSNTNKIADALKDVGLDFDVEKRPIFFGPNMKKIAKKVATVRTDREECLGVVGEGYEICQNETAFAFADYIDNKLTFTRGGMTYSGLCWVVGELPPIKILGEDYTPSLVLQNSFNGKYKVRASIVALGTYGQFNIALNGIANTLDVIHKASAPARMKQGQDTLVAIREYMDGLRKVAEKYATIEMSKEKIAMLLDILFPLRENMSETTKNNVIKKRDIFLSCYDNEGNKVNYGNAWGLIRAYAEFITKEDGKNTKTKDERKFISNSIESRSFTGFLKKLESVTGVKVA